MIAQSKGSVKRPMQLHLHLSCNPSKEGLRIIGNEGDSYSDHAQNMLFSKVLSFNSLFFKFPLCRFDSTATERSFTSFQKFFYDTYNPFIS